MEVENGKTGENSRGIYTQSTPDTAKSPDIIPDVPSHYFIYCGDDDYGDAHAIAVCFNCCALDQGDDCWSSSKEFYCCDGIHGFSNRCFCGPVICTACLIWPIFWILTCGACFPCRCQQFCVKKVKRMRGSQREVKIHSIKPFFRAEAKDVQDPNLFHLFCGF